MAFSLSEVNVKTIRGALIIFWLVFSSFICLPVFIFPTYVLRFFSRRAHRAYLRFMFGSFWSVVVVWFEKINGIKVKLTGERGSGKDKSVVYVSNHLTEMDMPFMWLMPYRAGAIGGVKFVTKASVRKVPILGWGINACEYLFLRRNWETDKLKINKHIASFGKGELAWWVIYPEGTDMEPHKVPLSQEFQRSRGLPILSKVLQPKVKGLHGILEALWVPSADTVVYDCTMQYTPPLTSMAKLLAGELPRECHIHLKRFTKPMIGSSEEEVKTWLQKSFEEKDRQLTHLEKNGCFEGPKIEAELGTPDILWAASLVVMFSALDLFLLGVWKRNPLYMTIYYVLAVVAQQIWVTHYGDAYMWSLSSMCGKKLPKKEA
eukprot:CAMPEP_0198201714 /NCGR_PEP_ID=MMETSP1445-20131203/4689_1 /TAXON_ID=36898 /ORGANISM="Pyramimonas sp., Strain CCMP2087" /LENGTH=375 /DNA_ID=CAMNT_0043872273 /DNA_START=26 /DNA_END=1153 /DNA_ORIENTATION=-